MIFQMFQMIKCLVSCRQSIKITDLKATVFHQGVWHEATHSDFQLLPLCPVFYSVIQSFGFFVFGPLLFCFDATLPILISTMKLWDGRQGGAVWGAPLCEWALSRELVLAGFLVSCILMIWDIPLWVSARYLFFLKRTRLTCRWKCWISPKKIFRFCPNGTGLPLNLKKISLFKYKQWINGLPWGQW